MVRTATYLTLSQASKETGKSKSVISKALKDGTMSYVAKDESGYKIDPAELFRVFPQNPVLEREIERSRTPERTGENALDVSMLQVENKVLYARIQDKDERIAELKEERQDLQRERDKWHETANKLLLTYSPEAKPPEKPVEAQNEVSSGEKTETEAKEPVDARIAVYGASFLVLLVIVAVMNYYQAEIKTAIDARLLGTQATISPPSEPAQKAEENRGERPLAPLPVYPIFLPDETWE